MTQVALKIAFNGEIHRSRVDLSVFQLSDLERLVAQTFRLEPGAFVLQYTDAEGDRLNVASDAEFAEACRVFLGGNDAVKSLRFMAVPRHQAAFQEAVADPIVASLETLIGALSSTLERVKSEGWAYQAHARGTAEAARQAARELEAPIEQVARESAAGAKSAAEGFSSFAQGLVGQIKQLIPEKKEAAPAPAAPKPTPPVVAAVVEQKPAAPAAPPVAPPAPVMTMTPAPVAVPIPTPTEAPEAPGVPVAFSEAELKWADELSLVHNIFPNVSAARVIDMLEQCEGNVNVVLNTLMEDA
ncbi:hypothetical protein PybrP1_008731 [[Pythium] brassicae (nom. inval.)]|nr:hypothetical protein PybrP1_008731 [[Pythium] brassicae (nom. inval.)]